MIEDLDFKEEREREIHQTEARSGKIRPDSGVEDSNNDVVSIIGVRPEAKGIGEAEKARGVIEVDVVKTVKEDGAVAEDAVEVGSYKLRYLLTPLMDEIWR